MADWVRRAHLNGEVSDFDIGRALIEISLATAAVKLRLGSRVSDDAARRVLRASSHTMTYQLRARCQKWAHA